MRIGGFDFNPGLWPTLATLATLSLLLGLGSWQLDRAAWKQALIDTCLLYTSDAADEGVEG